MPVVKTHVRIVTVRDAESWLLSWLSLSMP